VSGGAHTRRISPSHFLVVSSKANQGSLILLYLRCFPSCVWKKTNANTAEQNYPGSVAFFSVVFGGTAAAAQPPFRLGDPFSVEAISSSPHSIIVDYGIFCVFCMCVCVCMCVYCVFLFVFLQRFDTVGWVIRPVKMDLFILC